MPGLQKDTIFIPVTEGVDLTTEARLVKPPALLEAINARFGRGGGSLKRRGHLSKRVRAITPIPANIPPPSFTAPVRRDPYSTVNPGYPVDWLWGWGYVTGNPRASDTVANGISDHPDAGLLFGSTYRDKEFLAWNGFNLYSYSGGDTEMSSFPAVIPSLRAQPVAKVARAQLHPGAADNGRFRIVTWLDTVIHYTIIDSVTGTAMVVDKTLGTTPEPPKVLTLGNSFIIVTYDTSDSHIHVYSISSDNLTTVIDRSLGNGSIFFDVWKHSESAAVVLINDSLTNLRTSWIQADGTNNPNYTSATLTITGAPGNCAICVHPTTEQLGVVYANTTASPDDIKCAVYTSGGTTLGSIGTLGTTDNSTNARLTVAPKYLLSTTSSSLFDGFWEGQGISAAQPLFRRRFDQTGTLGSSTSKFHLYLASQGFRVGDRTFVWACHAPNTFTAVTLQATYFLLDELLNPVGHLFFGGASVDIGASISPINKPYLPVINWSFSGPAKDRLVFNFGLGYKLRVAASSSTTGLFTEASIQFIELDFLPPLRAAQAGRCTYFAGAQLGCYDGVSYTEAGFHLCPELQLSTNLNQSNGGSLTSLGTYQYKVDLVHKNGQNEEVRSLSILSPQVTLTGTNATITLDIPTCLTSRTDAYFLIYRNAMVSGVPGTVWYLVNTRDPSATGFVKNDQTVSTVQFVDGTLNDATLQARELHPGNAGEVYVQPIAAPACEIISSGRDRLWVAGGEIPAGQLSPSRLFQPGEIPAFNPYLNIQVDRSSAAITGIGFVGEIGIFFRQNQAYIQDGDGPDNVQNGSWAPPRLALADLGATSQESICLISKGLIFQSPSGFRLIGPSGSLVPIGVPVDALARDFEIMGSVVIDSDQEARWYGPDGAIVYNYLYDTWSTWTCAAVGVVRDPVAGRAVLTTSTGDIWLEDDTTHFLDNDQPYLHRIRFPWLHAGALGDFQRVRRIAGIGRWDQTDAPGYHFVHVEVYYDERPFPEEIFDWQYPDKIVDTDGFYLVGTNESHWGGGDGSTPDEPDAVDVLWGDYLWGENNTDANSGFGNKGAYNLNDASWDWRRRLHRQKCSVISIAIDDRFTPGEGFILNALGLELARKPGINRLPDHGGTSTYRE